MADPKLVIGGQEYPIPDLGDMDMDEAVIIQEYTGMTLSEFETATFDNPKVIAALIHIAFHRADDTETFAAIKRRVGKVKLAGVTVQGDTDEQEADAGPPAESSTLTPEPASTVDDAPSNGKSSEGTSDVTPETDLPRIGRLASGIGAG